MLSSVFAAVSTKDNGQYCKIEPALSGPTEDFCSPVLTNSYLRVYVSGIAC